MTARLYSLPNSTGITDPRCVLCGAGGKLPLIRVSMAHAAHKADRHICYLCAAAVDAAIVNAERRSGSQ